MVLPESIVVGEEGCTFKDVVDVFFSEVNSVAVFDQWSDFARELSSSTLEIKKWRQDILLNKLTVKDVLYEILETWKNEKGNEATLSNLHSHLEKVELKNIADDLRKLFSTENRPHKDAGQLFMPTLPIKPKYYIPRTLLTRKEIDANVFSSTNKDVFVIDEINRYRLSQLAGKELTDCSSNQVRKKELSVRFILLEYFGDWALLCGKTTNPIHLLRDHEGKFHWICTKGDISAFNNETDEGNQTELSEEDFIEEIETDVQFQTNQPILISDSPGMGKSLLLASIGRQLQQKYPHRCTAYIVISEFVVRIRELLLKQSTTKNAVVEALLQMTEKFSARQHLVERITVETRPTENPSTEIELMFDGFDEVSSENVELAHECLDILKTGFNSSIRVWVTTRPHHLDELQKLFSALGYKIEAFQEKHQIEFLTSFWKSHGTNLDEDKLKSFSETCLSTLKEKLNKRDQDIAGIPLQCMMIADVYMQDAHRFSDSRNKRRQNLPEGSKSININSITDLYERMIAYKIEKFIETYPLDPQEIRNIWPLHMYLALELIFPSRAHKFKDALKIESELEPDYLVNIGILEISGSTTENPARFVHRTFAEYLAARFLVLYEIPHGTAGLRNPNRGHSYFLFKHVLKIQIIRKTYSFINSVLCHFLNVLLASHIHSSAEKSLSQNVISCIKNVVCGCIHSDFGNIIRFLHSLKYPEGFSIRNILYPDSSIFIDATTITSSDLLKFLLQSFHHEPLNKIKGIKHLSPLHAAVRRGNYSIFEYILKQHDFEDLVKGDDDKLRDLVYCAVEYTLVRDPSEIQDRRSDCNSSVWFKQRDAELPQGQ